MPQIDWLELQAYLDESTPSAETDLRIEEAIAAALSTYSSESLPALIKALSVSDSIFVKQRVGFMISLLAPDDSMDAANALMSVVNESKGKDSFLYAQAIGAVGTFAKRNYLANAYVSTVLLQLQPTDSPYVLVQAAKVIGQLETNRKQGLRQALDAIGRADDLRVQAEVFQQKAMIDLVDAFSMETLTNLKAAIKEAQRGFKKAIESEENRDDAIVFNLLLDMMADFLDMSFLDKKLVAKKITEKNQEIIQFVNMPFRQSLRTNFEQLLNLRILHVADSFRKISQSVAQSEEWTNLDQALVDLVAVCALSQAKEEVDIFQAGLVYSPLEESFKGVFPKIVVPKVGLILKRTVGRVRLKKVIDNYIDSNGRDATSEGLDYIYKTAVENEYAVEDSGSSEIGLQPLKKAIEERGEDPDFFISSLIESLNSGEVEKWAEEYHYQSSPLSVDRPELFGNNSRVDEAARKLIKELHKRLESYPNQKNSRLINVCVEMVQIVDHIRDDTPDYCLSDKAPSSQKAGKGQQATERDLQEDLYARLRRLYGNQVSYEPVKVSGGRSDLQLSFEECDIPIEIKAEYRNIRREHIRKHYIAQSDIYASVRDRVSFLMILDLRASNTGKPPKNADSKQAAINEPYSLYTLEESFYTDGLPTDPQLENPQKKAVIVGLVQGNRPKPSWLTSYSRKPTQKKESNEGKVAQ